MDEDKSTGGTRHYDQPEADQAQRRAMLKQDAFSTYHAMAQGDPDAEGGPAVTGASPKPYGGDLPGPAWSRDLAALPKERPLGEDINAVNDISAVWFDPDYVAPAEEPSDEEA